MKTEQILKMTPEEHLDAAIGHAEKHLIKDTKKKPKMVYAKGSGGYNPDLIKDTKKRTAIRKERGISKTSLFQLTRALMASSPLLNEKPQQEEHKATDWEDVAIIIVLSILLAYVIIRSLFTV